MAGSTGDLGVTPGERVAFVFNRTALGVGVLLGLYHVSRGNWTSVAAILLLIAMYFWLHSIVDAP